MHVASKNAAACCHNAKLVQTPGALFSVPYDFDFSGLVNAPYAGANPVVNTGNVRRRVYRGYCTNVDTLAAAVDAFRPMRQEVAALFETTPGLKEKDARRAIRYLDGFFSRLEKDGLGLFAKCR